jgi:hypothetical protein
MRVNAAEDAGVLLSTFTRICILIAKRFSRKINYRLKIRLSEHALSASTNNSRLTWGVRRGGEVLA